MENNDNWAYVEMFGKVRYCKVKRSDMAKGIGKEHCFSGDQVCFIENEKGWQKYARGLKNSKSISVALDESDWNNFFLG